MIYRDARLIADYITALSLFDAPLLPPPSYQHMGAVLTDAILQSGVNYHHIVSPRVRNVLKFYPEADTVQIFSTVLLTHGAHRILQWTDDEKPSRLCALTQTLLQEGVTTHLHFAEWISVRNNRQLLLEIRGVGNKTVDYLANLVGAEIVAVDRHVVAFAQMAGARSRRYEEIQQAVHFAGDLLGLSYRTLDRAIWKHQTQSMSIPNRSRIEQLPLL
jgi:hypothetical protein